ncbi:hypothetical protein SFC52_19160 [Niallia circulans]
MDEIDQNYYYTYRKMLEHLSLNEKRKWDYLLLLLIKELRSLKKKDNSWL